MIFNLKLIKAPICCLEYVVLHELSHFKYQNHSKNFYNFVTIFMPDWNARKKLLDEMVRLGWDEGLATYWIWKDWREVYEEEEVINGNK